MVMNKMVNGVLVEMTAEEETARTAESAANQAETSANEYKQKRSEEYPSVGDQLDALWKGGAEAEAMKAIINSIKIKHPKPQE